MAQPTLSEREVAAKLVRAGADKLPPELLAELMAVAYPDNITLPQLMIRTKDARLVRLVPNNVQRILLKAWEQTYTGFDWTKGNWHALDGARETILKARQGGVSTLVEAIAYCLATTTPYYVAVIVADTKDRAKTLFRIVRRFYDHDPRKLKLKLANVNELHFKDLDSIIHVTTAGERQAAGRAATINFLHMTELAFWDNYRIRGALLDAVPLDTGIIIEETTANGFNQFYTHWQATTQGMTNFHARFIPWYALPEYSVPVQGEPDEETRAIMEKYGISHGQARWYIIKRNEKLTTDVPMQQEYPASPEEAFVASAGTAVFPPDTLNQMLTRAKPPLRKKIPGEDGLGGYLEIYEEPQKKETYVIGADVAEGLIGDKDHDYSTADVFAASSWKHVASYYGRPDVERFANDLYGLAAYYNDAVLVVERNNHGHAVLLVLEQLGANIYYHRNTPEHAPLPGFPTTAKSKAQRDAALRTAVTEEDAITINNTRAIAELRTYSELPGRKRGGLGNAHDDHVTSIGLAIWYLTNFLPKVQPTTKQDKHQWRGYQPYWSKK